MKVLCNTSPLLLLARIDRLDLLPALYESLIVPTAVLEEVNAQDDEVARHIREQVQHPAFQAREASAQHLSAVAEDLGKGERAAIALALETEADLVILDDEQGRQIARKHGFAVTGTIGVLIEARERKLIPSMRRALDRLVEAGLWIDEHLYHRVLQAYGE